ncbi:MAG: myxalamid-type nonribosomal peptide synthetase MxaA [Myxococcota bacterium]|jgi:myxalamid-type nonribosomal peptide synthetase MxaA
MIEPWPTEDAARRAVYAGRVLKRGANDGSKRLIALANELLRDSFDDVGPARDAQQTMDPIVFFKRMGQIRKVLYLEPQFHRAMLDAIAAAGFSPEAYACDPTRLRIVAHNGHTNPRAAPVYYGHRDTWYGHSQSLMTWWIPLDDLPAAETFVFYPERFTVPVPNDSERFDYDEWVSKGWGLKIGWQDRDDGLKADYPGPIGDIDAGPALGFNCLAGDNLLFSGAQYHQTLPQTSGRTRFSIDFRLVHLGAVILIDTLQAVVEERPNDIAIDDHGQLWTYSELWERAHVVCGQAIQATVDVEPLQFGGLVGLMLPKSADYIAAMIGLWQASMVVLPLPDELPMARRDAIAQNARCHWVLSEIKGVAREANPSCDANQLAYVIYTSGSTGKPKGVAVEHGSLLRIIQAQIDVFGIRPSDRCAWELSPAFDASLSDIFTTLLAGATLVIDSGGTVSERLARGRISVADLPPAVLPHLDADALPSSLRTIIFGGEVADAKAVRRLASRVEMITVYGPTEATICASSCRCDAHSWSRPLIGEPLPGVTFKVVDGELWIGGDGVARGYWRNPALTKQKFVGTVTDPWFRTGDRVRDFGGRLEFVGRIDRQLKVRGKLVAPEEIESILMAHPLVARAAVIPHQTAGTIQLEAIVECEESVSAPSERHQSLEEHLAHHLPEWMIPSRITVTSAFPETTSGKVDRRQLRSTQPAPTTPQSAILTRLWTEFLGQAPIATDDFFECGGDSLSGVAFLAAADNEGIRLPASAITESCRFGALVELAAADTGPDSLETTTLQRRTDRLASTLPRASSAGTGSPQVILLTGATGFLGQRLLRDLLSQPQIRVVALVRGATDAIARARVPERPDGRLICLRGDITRPRFGLDNSGWQRLADEVDTVVHSAARVHVALPFDRLAPANVYGTGEVLRLVATGRPKRLVYVSTLSVLVSTDRPAEHIAETDRLDGEYRVFGGYAQTKWVAERLVRHVCPAAIVVRLGLLTAGVNDAVSTAHAQRGNEWFDLFVRGVVAVGVVPFPSGSDLRVDITPVDFAASTLAAIMNRAQSGDTLHVANPTSATLGSVLDAIARVSTLARIDFESWRTLAITRLAESKHPEIGAALMALSRAATEIERPAFDLFAATGMSFGVVRTRRLLGGGIDCPNPDLVLLEHLVRTALGVAQ